MRAFFLTEDSADQLFERLEKIEQALKKVEASPTDMILDNEQLMKKLNVSKRTLQNWRDGGYISFSQIGHKIYYQYADVEAMLQSFKNSSFR